MKTELIKDFPPNPALEEYIRKYQVFRFTYNLEDVVPVKYYTPRPEQCITFYLRDVQRYSPVQSLAIAGYPRCVINGIHNVSINRHGGHDFMAIKVVLQPGALFCLTGIPPHELTNTFIDAEAVWGSEIQAVCQRLANAAGLSEMFSMLEQFLKHLVVFHLRKELHPVDKATRFILHTQQFPSLPWLADQSCLSVRQFIRKFEERQGISAKLFERIVRFDRAYRMKNTDPEADWLFIALSCGYYDYQHLVKDYKEFTSLTPQALFELERKSLERRFTVYEC